MRTSSNEFKNGKLWNGYDYDRQEWVLNGQPIAPTTYAGEDCAKCVKYISLCSLHKIQ